MDELARWYGEQLDEDERIARAATPGPWEQTPERPGTLASAEYWHVVDCSETPAARENAEHVAEWGPARVLREIDAKRQVIAKYTAAVERMVELAALIERLKSDGMDTFMPEMDRATAIHRRDVLYEVLQLHALPYADRPGYREEWTPSRG